MTEGAFLITLLVNVVLVVIALALLYMIIKSAIVSALQRARREAWTEIHMPEKAEWLTARQREQLAAQRDAS